MLPSTKSTLTNATSAPQCSWKLSSARALLFHTHRETVSRVRLGGESEYTTSSPKALTCLSSDRTIRSRTTAPYSLIAGQQPLHADRQVTQQHQQPQHGHHRHLLHSCLLFSDNTRRLGGYLEQSHQSNQTLQHRVSFGPGLYGFHA